MEDRWENRLVKAVLFSVGAIWATGFVIAAIQGAATSSLLVLAATLAVTLLVTAAILRS